MEEKEISYQHIKYFLKVAKKQSISRAAESLNITQSALSQAMKNLEESLGVTLFYRNTKGIVLTDDGKVFYQYGLIGDFNFKQAITKTLQNKNLGDVKTFKIAASDSIIDFYVRPHLNEIKKKFPNLIIEMMPRISLQNVQKSIQNDKIDLILFKYPRDVIMKSVCCQTLCRPEYKICYNPDFYSLPDKATIEEIKKYSVIIKKREDRKENALFMSIFPNLTICLNDLSVLRAVKSGAGIGVCEKHVAANEGLKCVDCDIPEIKRFLFVAFEEHNAHAKEIVRILQRP